MYENTAKLFKLNFQEGMNFSILIEACGTLSILKSRSRPSERLFRCSRLMAAYPPRFNDRWPCKRALAMHRPSNIPTEMQGRTEESKEISEEEEDG